MPGDCFAPHKIEHLEVRSCCGGNICSQVLHRHVSPKRFTRHSQHFRMNIGFESAVIVCTICHPVTYVTLSVRPVYAMPTCGASAVAFARPVAAASWWFLSLPQAQSRTAIAANPGQENQHKRATWLSRPQTLLLDRSYCRYAPHAQAPPLAMHVRMQRPLTGSAGACGNDNADGLSIDVQPQRSDTKFCKNHALLARPRCAGCQHKVRAQSRTATAANLGQANTHICAT